MNTLMHSTAVLVPSEACFAEKASAIGAVRPNVASNFVGLRKSANKAAVKAASAARKVSLSKISATATVSAPAKVDLALEEKCINTIRFLAIDAVEKAVSGHPGLPMGCAPMAYVTFQEYMKFNPKNPYFFNRDRFVLSAGHGCMLQYALLHLFGYDSVTTEELKQFRQWGSRTPGHPENFETPGVEVTTGPLGQGIANAVGLALSEAHLAARFNKPDAKIVDHYTFCILGDGCNMEGISNEAASLAGHWGLGKLICLYDDNHISIDGNTDIAFTEDVKLRFDALGWHTIWVKEGNTDLDSLRAAIEEAKSVTDRPTMIKVTTTIGYGSPNKANSYAVHGAALGAKEVAATRENLGWPYEPFVVPEEVKSHMNGKIAEGAEVEAEWNKALAAYESKYPTEAAEFKQLISLKLPAGWESALPTYTPESAGDSTRNLSQVMLNALANVLPGLVGGSADLASSNMTLMKQFGDFQKKSPAERNIRFGVREHAMGAICNGIQQHLSGLIPYCATFFIFTDYMRNAMRISALSGARVIYVMTHDSIGLGEDGPTHQPIEHLASFRAMPNILMFRPADGNETAGAYKVAVEQAKRPSVLALSRQKLPQLPGTSLEGTAKGGYVISDTSSGTPDLILLATGSELELAEKVAKVFRGEGKGVRVVSMVCFELYEEQSAEYKESVLPKGVTARVSIEAGCSFGWQKYTGFEGVNIAVDTFGASAPADVLYEKFGFGVDTIVEKARAVL
eukprot:TRINITY_DN32438_c0_g1_i1.p1 TRINITY_DN32438_c0_g1~~TRINITY_DN32438_c0_g1_i1.p1  ORF type:complete len:739 (-),score=136.92 TRINITY_DN32438_c0_g1_i1:892-3108(-)